MKSNIKKLPGSKVEAEITIDAPLFKEYWDTAYASAAEEVTIKGFRKGTAPKEMVDRAIDHEKVFEHATQSAIKESLGKVTEEHGWTVIDTPKVEIKEASPTGEVGLSYRAELMLFPEIKLPDYKKIASKYNEEKKEVTVTDEEIGKTLEWLQKSRAAIVRVERESKRGDLIEADVESSVNGKLLEDGSTKSDKIVIGESHFMKGFDDQLVGHRANDHVEFELSETSDKKFGFKVSIKGVFERSLSELNDVFAAALGPNFKTIDDVKTSIKEGLGAEKEKKEEDKRRIKILEDIAEKTEVDVPERMIQRTLESMINDFKQMLPPEKQNEEELQKSLEPQAKKNVINNLIIHEIAKRENLEPTPEEIAEELKKMNVDAQKDVDQRRYYDYSYSIIQSRKVFELLENHGKNN